MPSDECLDLQLRDAEGFWFAVSSQLESEAFLIYATALHRYLEENCPESLQQGGLVKDCLKRYKFIESLYNVSIQTNAGPKMFDNEGNMLLDFRIRQVDVADCNEIKYICFHGGYNNNVIICVFSYKFA